MPSVSMQLLLLQFIRNALLSNKMNGRNILSKTAGFY